MDSWGLVILQIATVLCWLGQQRTGRVYLLVPISPAACVLGSCLPGVVMKAGNWGMVIAQIVAALCKLVQILIGSRLRQWILLRGARALRSV